MGDSYEYENRLKQQRMSSNTMDYEADALISGQKIQQKPKVLQKKEMIKGKPSSAVNSSGTSTGRHKRHAN